VGLDDGVRTLEKEISDVGGGVPHVDRRDHVVLRPPGEAGNQSGRRLGEEPESSGPLLPFRTRENDSLDEHPGRLAIGYRPPAGANDEGPCDDGQASHHADYELSRLRRR
jgi:hypothetical protein